MKLLFAVISIVVLVGAQKPTCTVPSQWEGRFFETSTTSPGAGQVIQARIYYDALGERVRTNEYMENDQPQPRQKAVEILRLYKEKAEYRVDIRTKHCEKRDLNEPFRPFGPPPSARHEGTYYLGAKSVSSGVEVDPYVEDDQEHNHLYSTFTHLMCIPVYDHYRGVHEMGEGTMVDFYNITTGIQNPTVFTVPPSCQTENSVLQKVNLRKSL